MNSSSIVLHISLIGIDSSKNMQDCDACYHTNDKNLVDLVFYNLFYKKLWFGAISYLLSNTPKVRNLNLFHLEFFFSMNLFDCIMNENSYLFRRLELSSLVSYNLKSCLEINLVLKNHLTAIWSKIWLILTLSLDSVSGIKLYGVMFEFIIFTLSQ